MPMARGRMAEMWGDGTGDGRGVLTAMPDGRACRRMKDGATLSFGVPDGRGGSTVNYGDGLSNGAGSSDGIGDG
jgi:hypothetical protein